MKLLLITINSFWCNLINSLINGNTIVRIPCRCINLNILVISLLGGLSQRIYHNKPNNLHRMYNW